VANDGKELRRFPRLATRCRARVRDRFGLWEGETEDVGPRGCRIVMPRTQTVGALVSLTLECERLVEALEVAGQVVWASSARPARAGISFAGATSVPGAIAPAAWFEAVLAVRREEHAALLGPEIVIEVEGPVPEVEPLVDRLCARARELLGGGERKAAELIFRRALELAPGDAAVEAALRDLAAQ
jgi:PilZ domain